MLGKWRYAPYFDVFIGLRTQRRGHLDLQTGRLGATQSAGQCPAGVSVTSPTAGTDVAPATVVNLTATAADTDGSIARVEYYVNGIKVGQATSTPYALNIAPILVGSYSVVAVAVDNVGGMSGVGTRDLHGERDTDNEGAAARPQRLCRRKRHVPRRLRANRGTRRLDAAVSRPCDYRPLVRFAIFQSEGGPVPNGAVIQSATLALYKQYYNDTLRLNALLKPWSESQATWTISQTGVPWTVGGAPAPAPTTAPRPTRSSHPASIQAGSAST